MTFLHKFISNNTKAPISFFRKAFFGQFLMLPISWMREENMYSWWVAAVWRHVCSFYFSLPVWSRFYGRLLFLWIELITNNKWNHMGRNEVKKKALRICCRLDFNQVPLQVNRWNPVEDIKTAVVGLCLLWPGDVVLSPPRWSFSH